MSDERHPLRLLVPRILSLGAVVIAVGCHLTWSACEGAFCSLLRTSGSCTDTADQADCYGPTLRAIVHLFELAPVLLVVGGTVVSFFATPGHQRGEAAWKAWRSGSALLLGAVPGLLLLSHVSFMMRGAGPEPIRALVGVLMVGFLAPMDARRAGAWWWAKLAATCSSLLVAIASLWTWTVQTLMS